MITPQQQAHFEMFGFLFQKKLLSKDEVAQLTDEAERIWDGERAQPGYKVDESGSHRSKFFIESNPSLHWLAEDDRIYGTAAQIIGSELLFTGSEGVVSGYGQARWHPDRRTLWPGILGYGCVKAMIYLDETTADRGALRVIPGSHRNPMHEGLYQMLRWAPEGDDMHSMEETENPAEMPYGLPGDQMPAFIAESEPGDVLFFNQWLFHAAYNAWPGRRYVAAKFAQPPKNETHLKFHHMYNGVIFDQHKAFAEHKSERIRKMARQVA